MVLASLSLLLAAQAAPAQDKKAAKPVLPAWCRGFDVTGSGKYLFQTFDGDPRLKDMMTPLVLVNFVSDAEMTPYVFPLGSPLPERMRKKMTSVEVEGGKRYELSLENGAVLSWHVDPTDAIFVAGHARSVSLVGSRAAFVAAKAAVVRALGEPTEGALDREEGRIYFSWAWNDDRAVFVTYSAPVGGEPEGQIVVSTEERPKTKAPAEAEAEADEPEAAGSLPNWIYRIDGAVDEREVTDRPTVDAAIRRGPRVFTLAELLPDVPGAAVGTAPLGGTIPERFTREGEKVVSEGGEVQFVLNDAETLWETRYALDKSNRVASVTRGAFAPGNRSQVLYEATLARLKRRLGAPASVDRDEKGASLSMVWEWKGGTKLALSFSSFGEGENDLVLLLLFAVKE